MTEYLLCSAGATPTSIRATALIVSAIVRAARQLLTDLERGRHIDAAVLRNAMEAAFGACDASSAWNWKIAYACEAATILFVRGYGGAMTAKAAFLATMLPLLMRIAGQLPPLALRPGECGSLKQFSTPIELAFVTSQVAATAPADVVREPSAGTRLPVVVAELAGAFLILNEFAESRAGIFAQRFPAISTTRFTKRGTA